MTYYMRRIIKDEKEVTIEEIQNFLKENDKKFSFEEISNWQFKFFYNSELLGEISICPPDN